MSLYDNLANSDFMDPGEFKKQLNQISSLQDSQESLPASKPAGLDVSDFDPGKMEGSLEDGVNLGEEDTFKAKPNISMAESMRQRSYLGQNDIQADAQLKCIQDQVKKLELLKKQGSDERQKFEMQTKMRESIEADDLMEHQISQLQKITQENANYFGEGSGKLKIDDQRSKLIFDDNLEMSEREVERRNLQSMVALDPRAKVEKNRLAGNQSMGMRNISETLVPQDLKKESQKTSTYQTISQAQQPSSNGAARSNLDSFQNIQNDCQFTLNKYESRQELVKNEGRTHTNQTQRTENPDKDVFLLDQRGLDEEGTGQFGGGRAGQKWEEADKESRRNAKVSSFVPSHPNNGGQSPSARNSKSGENDQISQLLAQLKAPMSLNPVPENKIETSIDNIQTSQQEINLAHQQMQDSIRGMNQGNDGQKAKAHPQGFNGQNSIYEVAQKVGQPMSNMQSVSENENDFQRFMQGDGSLNSAQSNFNSQLNQFGLKSQGAQNEELATGRSRVSGTSGKYNPNIQNSAIEQANQLLMQMQDSSQRPSMVKRNSNTGLNNENKIFQNAAQNIFFNEKENFNGKNLDMEDQQYNQSHGYSYNQRQFQQPPPQVQPAKVPMSLAARANQAKMANQGAQNQQYRQKFDPQQYMQHQKQPPAYQMPDQQKYYTQHQRTMPQAPTSQPPMPYEGQNMDFSKTNKNDKMEKRKALLAQFDDIPIHQLHKAEGYQIRNIDDEEPPITNQGIPGIEEEEILKIDLKDQCFHTKWKIRCNAYKVITQKLLGYKSDKPVQKEDEMYGDPENPFDVYGPIMEQMIKDTNLIAQYEALVCLYTFIVHGQDIKSVTFTCNSYLLDKIQHTKQNFREITQKILLEMLARKQNIMPELLKRFSSKNSKVVNFCIQVLNEAVQSGYTDLQDINFKLVYKQTSGLLGHSNQEIRNLAHEIIKFVWENCEDDLPSFCQHLTSLRPLQLQQLKEELANQPKSQESEYLVKLFDKIASQDQKKEDKSSIARSKSQESIRNEKSQERREVNMEEAEQVDLTLLLPDNFMEIPYLTQINVKRRALEAFNKELENLVGQQIALDQSSLPEREGDTGSVVKLGKDYSQIYNILVHMLEDPNALVFIEAIKIIGSLSILCKQTIKQSKMKQFVNLLADKYKETKTAVLQALERSFHLIFENKCLTANQFYELLINQISSSHKNPRVKQMVIDRVEALTTSFYLDPETQCGVNNPQLLVVFKNIKTKLKQIIVKDTNASVRDAGVSLLAKFRVILGSNCLISEYQDVIEVIDSLPKQRIAEINKRVDLFEDQPARQEIVQAAKFKQEEKEEFINLTRESDVPSKNCQDDIRSKVSDRVSAHNLSTSDRSDQFGIPRQYQANLSDMIMTIKNISQQGDRLRPAQIVQNLEEGLRQIGNEGIKECKSSIITCIYWLLTQYPQRKNFMDQQREESIKTLLHFMIRLFSIDDTLPVHKNEQNGMMECVQLQQAICSSVICFALFEVQETAINSLLGQLYGIACKNSFPTVQYLAILKQAMMKYDPKPHSLPGGRSLIMSNVLYFISDRIPEFIQRSQKENSLTQSLQISDFEEFQSLIIGQLSFVGSEVDKQILIQALEYLKVKIHTHRERAVKSMTQDAPANSTDDIQVFLPKNSPYQPEEQRKMEVPPVQQTPQMPRHQDVVETIRGNFEQGLLKLKEYVKDEQNGNLRVSFEQKEEIVVLLLHLTTQGFKSPTEQYKQAYSLKALMWLKEEFIGMEDTFKLTSSIMDTFAGAVIEGRDSSIEQYLLMNWTKNLSLRDIMDRISISTRFSPGNSADTFNSLFNWVLKNKLEGQWTLEDFRKVALFLAQDTLTSGQSVSVKFLEEAVSRFSPKRVRDFMEIQLIQQNTVLIKFLDFFDAKFDIDLQQEENHIKIAKNNNESLLSGAQPSISRKDGDTSLQEPLLTNRSNGGVTDRSTLLQEMRDRRKELHKGRQEDEDIQSTLAEERKKYEEIMQKLERYKNQRTGREADEGKDTLNDSLKGEKIINPHQEQHRISATSKGRTDMGEDGLNVGQIRKAKDIESRPISEHNTRYDNPEDNFDPKPLAPSVPTGGHGRNVNSGSMGFAHQEGTTTNSMAEFNDDEDFKLSTDNHHSIAYLGQGANIHNNSRLGLNQSKAPSDIHRGLQEGNQNQSQPNALGSGIGSNSVKVLGEGLNSQLEGREEDKKQYEMELQESRQKLKQSVQYQEERMQRLQSSQIKVRQFKNELEQLEHEKKKLEMEKEQLLNEQNKESEQWKQRYNEMTNKNDEIVANLAEANRGYFRQVAENEKMLKQIQDLQEQHKDLAMKYRQMEEKLQHSEQQIEVQKQQLEEGARKKQESPRESQIVEATQLKRVEEVFDNKNQVMSLDKGTLGVKAVQELLLNSEGQTKLSKPLIFHYQKMRSKSERMQMMIGLKQALENEDVLFAINSDVYKSLLNFLLSAFSFEKELIERESLSMQHEREQQNELTQESQRLVSKLLNSKEFTTSLICLIQLLKTEAMPEDISVQLSIQQLQLLRVLMRCISRITKALHSENPDLIRAFDVLLEMHKLFKRHPPENLRQDLPCLADFDFVYRGLKDVSDKLIELQPDKCKSFLTYFDQKDSLSTDADSEQSQDNAFTRYIRQMVSMKEGKE